MTLSQQDIKAYHKYYTPPWATRFLWDQANHWFSEKKVLEPCAGDLHIAKVLRARGAVVSVMDIHPSHEHYGGLDFLKLSPTDVGTYNYVVTNPPYTTKYGTAAEIIRHALDFAPIVWALLRLPFLEPCSDREHLLAGRLREVMVLPNPRLQFENAGDSNNSQSAWFKFDRYPRERPTIIKYYKKEDREWSENGSSLVDTPRPLTYINAVTKEEFTI